MNKWDVEELVKNTEKEVQEQFELSMRATIGMDMGQLLSIPFILIGLSFIFFALRKRKNKLLMD